VSLQVASVAAPGALATRVNPLVKLATAVVVTAGVFLASDLVTSGVVALGWLIAFPLLGLRPLATARRAWPLLVTVIALLGVNLLFSEPDGTPILLDVGPLHVTTGSVEAALTVSLRLLAIALSGVVFAAATDPTDLADALTQQLHAPSRIVLPALAALRMAPLMHDDHVSLHLARRSRGVGGGGPVHRIRMFGQALFSLLVSAIRRGVRLATAMDSRAFGAHSDRTHARTASFSGLDLVYFGGATLLVVAGMVISARTGHFEPIWR
jgi:energy-coupling factor transport system permease protein